MVDATVTPIGEPIRDAAALADALDTWLDRVVALAMKGKQAGDDGDRTSSDLYATAVLERIGGLGPDATRMMLTALVSKHADELHAAAIARDTWRREAAAMAGQASDLRTALSQSRVALANCKAGKR